MKRTVRHRTTLARLGLLAFVSTGLQAPSAEAAAGSFSLAICTSAGAELVMTFDGLPVEAPGAPPGAPHEPCHGGLCPSMRARRAMAVGA